MDDKNMRRTRTQKQSSRLYEHEGLDLWGRSQLKGDSHILCGWRRLAREVAQRLATQNDTSLPSCNSVHCVYVRELDTQPEIQVL